MGVFGLSDHQGLVALTPSEFENENDFQQLLEKYPALLSGSHTDDGTPRRWLLIKREKSIAAEDGGSGRSAVDHLFVDQEGIPTLGVSTNSVQPEVKAKVRPSLDVPGDRRIQQVGKPPELSDSGMAADWHKSRDRSNL
jgi:hypothetical protein